jgi:hypothetical protein
MARLTPEEKVAVQILTAISDIRLDLTLLGRYLAQVPRPIVHARLNLVIDSMRKHIGYIEGTAEMTEELWRQEQ